MRSPDDEARFKVYKIESRDDELHEAHATRADFASVPKVDTHLHASAIMTATQLSRFMRAMFERDCDRPLLDEVAIDLLAAMTCRAYI